MWCFFNSMVWNTTKNICGDGFHRSLRDEISFYSITSHFVAG